MYSSKRFLAVGAQFIAPGLFAMFELSRWNPTGLRNEEITGFSMLPNGSDVRFLGQCGVAELHKLDENRADESFRNRAEEAVGMNGIEIYIHDSDTMSEISDITESSV